MESSGLMARVLVAVLATGAGATLGWVVGSPWQLAQPAMLIGAVLVVATVAALDTLRGERLLGWLRGSLDRPAPTSAGYWGEMAYRVERLLRLRERAVEDERRRLQQFLSAMDASPNGIVLLDAAEQIDWCNSVAADHFGLDPKRDRGQPVTNLIRMPAFVAYLQRGMFDEPVLLQPGPPRPSLSVVVRPYGDGQKLLLSVDVTERERTEAMRRDFVANVSHEMRTPLTVLAGFVETMGSLPLTDAERQRVLTLMSQQTQRMQSLLADLLTLAQLEGSPRPPADRWTRLGSLLSQALADGQALSGGRHQIRLVMPHDAEVAGSPTELLSAVGNLVSNAVRYTPDGGLIEIRWQLRRDGGGEIDVVDNGIGIAREHLPRLTERFYRVDGSRSRDTGGTGLGLSIVKHVVQRHGGSLDVHSEPGRGSRFRLLLPPARVRVVDDAADVIAAPPSH